MSDQSGLGFVCSVSLFQFVAERVTSGVGNFVLGNAQAISQGPEGEFVEVIVCHFLVSLKFTLTVQDMHREEPVRALGGQLGFDDGSDLFMDRHNTITAGVRLFPLCYK